MVCVNNGDLTHCGFAYLLQARTEAEHMRLEVRRLESSLDRKEVQLMELQVRLCCNSCCLVAVAESVSRLP